jgi:hypothetical protein
LIEEDGALDHAPGDYHAISAIGVIGAGAAPISVFDTLMDGLGTGGRLVFSFNDRALAVAENTDKVQHYADQGLARILFQEYGEHLPGYDMKSNVYVIEKT